MLQQNLPLYKKDESQMKVGWLEVLKYDFKSLETSAAKPDPFLRVEPDFGPKIRVELGRVCPQGRKTGPIGSGWYQIGF